MWKDFPTDKIYKVSEICSITQLLALTFLCLVHMNNCFDDVSLHKYKSRFINSNKIFPSNRKLYYTCIVVKLYNEIPINIKVIKGTFKKGSYKTLTIPAKTLHWIYSYSDTGTKSPLIYELHM